MDSLTSRCKETKDVYTMGALTFDSKDKALSFIEELQDILLPGECWNFEQEIEGKTEYPILESYIKNVYYKLVKDHLSLSDNPNKGKLVFSEDKRYLLFNSGLLNRFVQDIYIIGEVVNTKDGEFILCKNPLVAKNKRDLVKTYYFNADSINNVPMVQFFTTIEQVIFYADKNIDMDYDNLLHIVEERNVRWPVEYQKYYEQGNFLKIANDLQSAIHNARIIAKRNYKYVVPQYRPTKDTLQFLMPIYLSGDYESSADFALVLDYDDNAGYYVPRTLLNLDVAYNNARLIAKPEETWLNPKKIDAISTSLEEELGEV